MTKELAKKLEHGYFPHLPNIHDFDKPSECALLVLQAALESGHEKLTASEIGATLLEVGISFSSQSISNALVRITKGGAKKKVHTFKNDKPKTFKIMKPGTDYLISLKPKTEKPALTSNTEVSIETPPAERAKKIFVVHGRNEKARKALFSFLRSLNLEPLEFSTISHETSSATPYIGEILDRAFEISQAIVVLMTPDDEAKLKDEFHGGSDPGYEKALTGQSRPNVLFEAGMAFGRCPDRTILIELGDLRPFSDIGGRHVIHLNDTPKMRQNLADKLKKAGCTVDLVGRTDWHTEGDFEGAVN